MQKHVIAHHDVIVFIVVEVFMSPEQIKYFLGNDYLKCLVKMHEENKDFMSQIQNLASFNKKEGFTHHSVFFDLKGFIAELDNSSPMFFEELIAAFTVLSEELIQSRLITTIHPLRENNLMTLVDDKDIDSIRESFFKLEAVVKASKLSSEYMLMRIEAAKETFPIPIKFKDPL